MIKTVFTKQDTLITKGVAICLMVWLHLFGFPNRLSNDVSFVQVFKLGNINFEHTLINLSILCVPMFIFLSGYGMFISSRKKRNSFLDSLKRSQKFLFRYWFCFFVFIPIGLIFFNHKPQYAWNLPVFLKNFFAISWSYNEEWWFVQLYLILIIVSPLLFWGVSKYPVLTLLISFGLFSTPFDFLKQHHLAWGTDYTFILHRQFVFVLGSLFARYDFFKYGNKVMSQNSGVKWIIFFVISVLCLFFKKYTNMRLADPLVTPFFIFAIIAVFRNNFAGKMLAFLGTYSLYIWLIHTFFCYYYWPKFVYWPRISIFIFFWTMFLSIEASFTLAWVYGRMGKAVNFLKIKNKI